MPQGMLLLFFTRRRLMQTFFQIFVTLMWNYAHDINHRAAHACSFDGHRIINMKAIISHQLQPIKPETFLVSN